MELGVKWESVDWCMGVMVVLFDICKCNVLMVDLGNVGYLVLVGEICSWGLEFDFVGQVMQCWCLNVSLVFNDVEILCDNMLEVGGCLFNVFKVNGSVLVVYENVFFNGQCYGIGGGVICVGKCLGQVCMQVEVDVGKVVFDLFGYIIVKLVVYWCISFMLCLMLDVDNFFDKIYYISLYSWLWVMLGIVCIVIVGF